MKLNDSNDEEASTNLKGTTSWRNYTSGAKEREWIVQG